MKSVNTITYVGGSLHIDSQGKTWIRGDVNSYTVEGDQKAFLNSRPDIEFMVEYGEMRINTSIIDAKAKINNEETKEVKNNKESKKKVDNKVTI